MAEQIGKPDMVLSENVSIVKEGNTIVGDNFQLQDSITYDEIKQSEVPTILDNIKAEFLSTEEQCNVNNVYAKIEKGYNDDDKRNECDNGLLYCEECEVHYKDYCFECGMLAHILNNTASHNADKRTPDLPDSLLEVRDLFGQCGIFASKIIPEGVRFGPFTGINRMECPWKLKGGKFIVKSDNSNHLNWMQFINPARDISEQNLLVFRWEDNLYYESIRPIEDGEELLVYFGEEYEDSVLKNIEVDFISTIKYFVRDAFACTFCCLGFSSKSFLAKHKTKCFKNTDGEFSIEELKQCPSCKVHLHQKEYIEHHSAYCCEKNDRKRPSCALDEAITENEEVEFNCELCKYKTKKKIRLKSHTKRVHCKRFKCETCNFETNTRHRLELHVRTEHPVEDYLEGKVSLPLCANATMNSVSNIMELIENNTLSRDIKIELKNLGPPRPDLLIKQVEFNSKTKKTMSRKFNRSSYTLSDWLCGCNVRNAFFCFVCLIKNSPQSDPAWTSKGVIDLKHLGEKVRRHKVTEKHLSNMKEYSALGKVNISVHKRESSAEHMPSAPGCKRLKSTTINSTIQDSLKENSRIFIQKFNENVRLNRCLMQLAIRATLYLGKQELSFRGHREDLLSNNRRNFKELLDTFVAISPIDIQEHYKTVASVFTGNSETIQNELIGCISDYIDEHIDKEIKECEFFSIQVDDTTGIGRKTQCSIIIRYVIAGGAVKERFLGIFDVSSKRNADTLFNLVTSCLEKHEYKSKLVAQCYDGASYVNSLQAKIKQVSPQAVFVHSTAHRLDLVLQQSCNSISKCRVFSATVNDLPPFFHHSAKHTNVDDRVMGRRVSTAASTKWTSNSKMLNVINNDWESLKQIFSEIIDDESSDQTSFRQCRGFLKEFNDFEFALLVIIFSDIFVITDVIDDVLQKKSLDINYCVSQITNIKKLLHSKRNRNAYVKLFETALSRTTLPTDHHEGRSRVTVFEKYKVLYFEILDAILMQINIRFEDLNKIQFVRLIDVSKFEIFTKTFPIDALNSLKECYPTKFNDVQLQKLKGELQIIYRTEQYRRAEPFFKAICGDSDVFKEAYRLFSLILTIPSTNAFAAERGVACLKRIKTYLRSTTAEERFKDLSKISIEKELLNELLDTQPFYNDIIDKFAALKNIRIELMFKK